MRSDALPATISAAAVAIGGSIILAGMQFGPISGHMATHIAIMNGLAPAVAVAVLYFPRVVTERASALWVCVVLQCLLLLMWHLPIFQVESALPVLLMSVALFLTAACFWVLVLRAADSSPWRAMIALMITGKVACLLGGLFIFAPRLLFPESLHAVHGEGPNGLEDQQLAGLLMISVCPLSYVIAGIVVAAQMLSRLERFAEHDGSPQFVPSLPRQL